MNTAMKQEKFLLIVNFGGPRSLDEIAPFLRELLCDQEVIRSSLPPFLHRLLFNRVANKRAKSIVHDYEKIGGKSPIFEDTEAIAGHLEQRLNRPVLAFHRYLPSTHRDFLDKIERLAGGEIEVFPLFPQFSYATTGSIALWMNQNLPKQISKKLRWIHSYAADSGYIAAKQACIRQFLKEKGIAEKEAILLYSAHGLPQSFICTGDIYQNECERSYGAIKEGFPEARHLLAYQSKFGKGQWLRPYTSDICKELESEGRKHVLFIPLSFPSDHIETLFEIEELYLPLVRERGIEAWRVPALNRRADWMEAIAAIVEGNQPRLNTSMLLRDTEQRQCRNCWCKR